MCPRKWRNKARAPVGGLMSRSQSSPLQLTVPSRGSSCRTSKRESLRFRRVTRCPPVRGPPSCFFFFSHGLFTTLQVRWPARPGPGRVCRARSTLARPDPCYWLRGAAASFLSCHGCRPLLHLPSTSSPVTPPPPETSLFYFNKYGFFSESTKHVIDPLSHSAYLVPVCSSRRG